MRKVIFFSCFLLFFFSVSLVIFGADKDVYVVVTSEGKATAKSTVDNKLYDGFFKLEGCGIAVGPGVYLTAAHVVEPLKVIIRLPSEILEKTKTEEVLTRKIRVNGEKAALYYIDTEKDIAVLSVVAKAHSSVDVPLLFTGNPSDLLPNASVKMVARARGTEGDFLSPPEFEERQGFFLGIERDSERNREDMVVDIKVLPGDSGSGIFVKQGKSLILIGVLSEAQSRLGSVKEEGKKFIVPLNQEVRREIEKAVR